MNLHLGFLDQYHVADVAARAFADWRTQKHPGDESRNVRTFLRKPAVEVLRLLWKSGDKEARLCVACRVALWMGHPKARVEAIAHRIKQANA